MTVGEIIKLYSSKLDYIDIELLLMDSLGKTREFVLTYPEYEIPTLKISNLKLKISRRMRGEPIAHILGHKEFYGLNFIVNKHTLVPRPETELMVEQAISSIASHQSSNTIIDIGTGSGCIIISIANSLKDIATHEIQNTKYYAVDISKDALAIAKQNAKLHKVSNKIKFLESNLLSAFIQNTKYLLQTYPDADEIRDTNLIITANLPYLSKDIYNSAPIDVKKFEPKSALYSSEQGLQHYRKLLEQINKSIVPCSMFHVSCFFEISPEQKSSTNKLIKSIFPKAKTTFIKDLAGKWRVCKIVIK